MQISPFQMEKQQELEVCAKPRSNFDSVPINPFSMQKVSSRSAAPPASGSGHATMQCMIFFLRSPTVSRRILPSDLTPRSA